MQYTIQMKSYHCETLKPEQGNVTCKWNPTNKSLSLTAYLVNRTDHLNIRNQLFYKAASRNPFRPFIVNVNQDYCSLFREQKGRSSGIFFLDMFMEGSNKYLFNAKCPLQVRHLFIIKSLYFIQMHVLYFQGYFGIREAPIKLFSGLRVAPSGTYLINTTIFERSSKEPFFNLTATVAFRTGTNSRG